jgi:hypothetical protein
MQNKTREEEVRELQLPDECGACFPKCKSRKTGRKHAESSLISHGVERTACKTVWNGRESRCAENTARRHVEGDSKMKGQRKFKKERLRTISAAVMFVQDMDSHVQSNSISFAKKKWHK